MNTLTTSMSLFTKAKKSLAFPTMQSTIPNFGNSVFVDLDGSNMVLCSQGGRPVGNPYTYLYWSDNYGETLNIATIDGSTTTFFGCVAISGANAIAMGRLTSAGTTSIYLSSDYGRTYVTGVSSFGYGAAPNPWITMSGANAAFCGYQQAIFVSTNYGASWANKGNARNNVAVKMYDNILYQCAIGAEGIGGGLYYSTNFGNTFTRSTTYFSPNCITKVGTTLYAGANGPMYKSTDNGVTFNIVDSGRNFGGTSCIAGCAGTNGDFVWVGNNNTSTNYYSNDGGTTWTTVNVGQPKPLTCYITPTNIVAGSADNGGFYWGKNAYIV